MLEYLVIAIFMFIMFWIGLSVGKKDRSLHAGSMVINTTDPKKDTIRIELAISVAEMMESKRLEFEVVKEES